ALPVVLFTLYQNVERLASSWLSRLIRVLIVDDPGVGVRVGVFVGPVGVFVRVGVFVGVPPVAGITSIPSIAVFSTIGESVIVNCPSVTVALNVLIKAMPLPPA